MEPKHPMAPESSRNVASSSETDGCPARLRLCGIITRSRIGFFEPDTTQGTGLTCHRCTFYGDTCNYYCAESAKCAASHRIQYWKAWAKWCANFLWGKCKGSIS